MSDSRVGVGDELVMRTFRWNAPIIIGAGALVLLSVAPAPSLLRGEERQAEGAAVSADHRPGFGDRSDRVAARRALEFALSELGDGVTLVWRRPERGLVGRIMPVSAFRDDKRAASAATSSTRSHSAPIGDKSKALRAGSRTAPGRSPDDQESGHGQSWWNRSRILPDRGEDREGKGAKFRLTIYSPSLAPRHVGRHEEKAKRGADLLRHLLSRLGPRLAS